MCSNCLLYIMTNNLSVLNSYLEENTLFSVVLLFFDATVNSSLRFLVFSLYFISKILNKISFDFFLFFVSVLASSFFLFRLCLLALCACTELMIYTKTKIRIYFFFSNIIKKKTNVFFSRDP